MAELILSIIKEGLPIVDKLVPDEASKIRARVSAYLKEWDEEMAKGPLMDDSKLGALNRELLDIGNLYAGALKQAATKN